MTFANNYHGRAEAMNQNSNDSKRDASDSAMDGWLEDGRHHYRARIYYADTDLSGAVYHARYLEMLERGRSDFLRLSDILHSTLEAQEDPVFWVVRRMEVDWLRSARIDNIVEIATGIIGVKGARVFMTQHIMRGDEVLLEAQVTAALVNREGRPQRFPKRWLEMFSGNIS
ncbi:MAG: YbgC/FadM family acyl-CoA thioesterase [Pseudomonadota bacterium]